MSANVEDRHMISNEGLAIEIKNLSLQIADLKSTVATTSTTFISVPVFELRMKQVDLEILQIKADIRKTSSNRWVQNSLSAIFGAVLAILVGFFFTHIGG